MESFPCAWQGRISGLCTFLPSASTFGAHRLDGKAPGGASRPPRAGVKGNRRSGKPARTARRGRLAPPCTSRGNMQAWIWSALVQTGDAPVWQARGGEGTRRPTRKHAKGRTLRCTRGARLERHPSLPSLGDAAFQPRPSLSLPARRAHHLFETTRTTRDNFRKGIGRTTPPDSCSKKTFGKQKGQRRTGKNAARIRLCLGKTGLRRKTRSARSK